jgi:NAD(P)-dependent dehydrogenase (short-subunit alcohol dehydrogenase family)
LTWSDPEISTKPGFPNSRSVGVFMTAQAVAKEMIRWGNGGSIAMIASMSGSVANRVRVPSLNTYLPC